jgi:hypothetical protein
MDAFINSMTTHFSTVMCVRYSEGGYGPLEVFITRDECNEFASLNYVAIIAAVAAVAVLIIGAVVLSKKLRKG